MSVQPSASSPKPKAAASAAADAEASLIEKSGCNVCSSQKSTGGGALEVCARCLTAKYCSREHQKLDWKAHKPACKQLSRWARDPNLRLASLLDTAQANLRGANGKLALAREAAEQAVALANGDGDSSHSHSSEVVALKDPVRCKFLALREMLNHQVLDPTEAMRTCVQLVAFAAQSGEAELVALSRALLALQFATVGRFTNARRELSQCDPANLTHTDDRTAYYRAHVLALSATPAERAAAAREIFDEVRATAAYVRCLPTALYLCALDSLLTYKEQKAHGKSENGSEEEEEESLGWITRARNHAHAGVDLLEKAPDHADRPLLKDLLLVLLEAACISNDRDSHAKLKAKWDELRSSVYVSKRELNTLQRCTC